MKFGRDTKVLIVGLGLMGGSYAMALSRKGYSVRAISRKQSTIDYALAHKMIEYGETEVTKDLVGWADLTVFALYPHIFIQWIEQYKSYFKPGSYITDVTGVKMPIVTKIQDILRDDVEFIPAHPMCGREVYGVENADDHIFSDANFIVTPTEKNTPEAIELCKDLGWMIGCYHVSELSIEKHDEMIGFVSQLTHCIAISLMTCNETENLEEYTGDSFRDLTRIANINDEMWSELFIANKKPLLRQMNLFENQFEVLKQMIENEDISGMREVMKRSTERRKLFNK